MRRFSVLMRRILGRIVREGYRYLGIDSLSGAHIESGGTLIKIGSSYGGWVVPRNRLDSRSICYCVGAGEDISFDIGLIERYGCSVYTFDPTPRSQEHVRMKGSLPDQFRFIPTGIWDKDDVVRFYAPANPSHVSHSIVNLQSTGTWFEASCLRLSSMMHRLGHSRLDLLKLDIEGAEYRVLDSIIEDRLNIGIICVEYDEAFHPMDADFRLRIRRSIDRLRGVGFDLINVDGTSNYTLVKA